MNSIDHDTTEERDPEYLYKYYSINDQNLQRREKIFLNNELYFPSPSEFNDPFDSKIQLMFDGTKAEWESYLRELYKKFRPEWNRQTRLREVRLSMRQRKYKRLPEDIQNSHLDKIGVFCMSEINDHILMWAHYAAGHTGFCLEFKSTSMTPFFGRAQKINYCDVYPSLNFFKSSRYEQMETTILTKSRLWSYEREWRIIEHNQGAGTYQFPAGLLTGVILGCQVSDKNAAIIRDWVKGMNPKPILYRAEAKEKEFGLDIEKLD